LFDTDDDGMISKQELQKILTKCKGKSSQKEVFETLEDFDGCLDYKGELVKKLFTYSIIGMCVVWSLLSSVLI